MVNHTKNETVAFIHIPKAGGSTFHEILYRAYKGKPARTLHLTEDQSLADTLSSVQELAECKMVKGHMPYGIHTYLPKPTAYITFLRDPIKRLISYYHYVKSHDDNRHYRAANSMSMGAFFEAGFLPKHAMTRRLAGFSETASSFDVDPTAGLAQAKHNLDQFAIVGLVERFDESVLLMAKRFNWRFPFYTRLNVGEKKRMAPAPDIEAILRETVGLDHDLYAHAVTLFKRQATAYDGDLTRDCKTFQRNNAMIQPIYLPYLRARRRLASNHNQR